MWDILNMLHGVLESKEIHLPPYGIVSSTAHKVTLSMGVFAQLTRLQFHPATASVHSGADLRVELTLRCLMPTPVRIQQVVASIHFDVDRGGTRGRSKGTQRLTNPGTVEFTQGNSSAGPPSSSSAGPPLELDEIHDRSPSDNALNSAGVVCKNTHLVLRRHDSNTPPDTPNCVSPPAVAMKEGAQMLKVQDVTLEPGNNSITFTAPVRYLLFLLFSLCLDLQLIKFSFVLVFYLPRVNSQVLTLCASCVLQWVRCSLCCLIFTHRSSMKCILRSPSSPWSLSPVKARETISSGQNVTTRGE